MTRLLPEILLSRDQEKKSGQAKIIAFKREERNLLKETRAVEIFSC